MSVLLFLVILGVLVFVHELGHFLLAKVFGVRVDEFAIGFPPRIISRKVGETTYALNLIPIGGYVKIFGEDGKDTPAVLSSDFKRNLVSKNRALQALVLAGGVSANVIFAWILLSVVFMIGAPVSSEEYKGESLENGRLLVVEVLPQSPASQAGIRAGDTILSLSDGIARALHPSVESVQQFISAHKNENIFLTLLRGGKEETISVIPKAGVVGEKALIGISMEEVGTLRLGFLGSLYEGARRTMDLTVLTARGLGSFLFDAIHLRADFSQISGPVGIAAMVGDAQALGLFYLFSFTALISLNLAVINLIPFPALDGGRLLFVAIEAIIRRRLSVRFTQTLNTAGFIILMLFILVVTYKDIVKIMWGSV